MVVGFKNKKARATAIIRIFYRIQNRGLIAAVLACVQINLLNLNHLSLPKASRSILRNSGCILQPKACAFLTSFHALSKSLLKK